MNFNALIPMDTDIFFFSHYSENIQRISTSNVNAKPNLPVILSCWVHVDMFGHLLQINTKGNTDSDKLSFTIKSKITLSIYNLNQASHYYLSGAATILSIRRMIELDGCVSFSFHLHYRHYSALVLSQAIIRVSMMMFNT